MEEACRSDGLGMLYLGLMFGVLILLVALRSFVDGRVLVDTPVSRMRSLAMGRVLVTGRTGPATLLSPLLGRPCVYYSYRIVTGSGDSERVLDSGSSGPVPIRLIGETGEVLLDPRDVSVALPAGHDIERKVRSPSGWLAETARRRGISLPNAFSVEELAIPPDFRLTALGVAKPPAKVRLSERLARLVTIRARLNDLADAETDAAESASPPLSNTLSRFERRYAIDRVRDEKRRRKTERQPAMTESELDAFRADCLREAEALTHDYRSQAPQILARLSAASGGADQELAQVVALTLSLEGLIAKEPTAILGNQPSRRRSLELDTGEKDDILRRDRFDSGSALLVGVVLTVGSLLGIGIGYPECRTDFMIAAGLMVCFAVVVGLAVGAMLSFDIGPKIDIGRELDPHS